MSKKFKTLVQQAMEEVHKSIPSTVTRANVSGQRREKMLEAIAFSKARKRSTKK